MRFFDRRQLQFVCTACTCIAGVTLLSGCVDSDASRRDDVQAAISKAGAELQVVLASASVPSDADGAPIAKLQAIVTQLNAVQGGEPGQQTAKAILASTALRQLADMHMTTADAIEDKNRDQRAVMHVQLDSALQLNAIASGMAKVTAADERAALARDLDKTKSLVAELSAKISQMEGPISQRTQQNAASAKEVEALRLEVVSLLRRASELGRADGFETFKQAKQVDREADRIQYEMSQTEIELDYNLAPEQRMAAAQAQQLQTMIASIEAVQQQLEGFAQVASGDVAASRAKVNELMATINKSLAALNDESKGKLQTEYDEAASALEKAASQVTAASRQQNGEDAQSAKLIAARLHEALGRLHWTRARGHADQMRLLQRLNEGAKEIGVNADYAIQLTATKTAQDEQLQRAKEAFESAIELAGTVQSRNDPARLEQFQSHLADATDALSGKAAPEAPRASSGSSTATPAVELGPGYASAQELIDFVKSLASSQDSLTSLQQQVDAATYASTPQAMQAKEMQRALVGPMQSLVAAMTEKFGRDETMKALKGASMDVVPDLTDAVVKNVDDAHASVTFTAGGRSKTQWLIKVNDRWYFDGDKLDPEDQQALMMKDVLVPGMTKALSDTAQKVSSGGIPDAAQVVQALQQAVMAEMAKAMGGGMGGMTPPPSGASPNK